MDNRKVKERQEEKKENLKRSPFFTGNEAEELPLGEEEKPIEASKNLSGGEFPPHITADKGQSGKKNLSRDGRVTGNNR